MTDQRARMLDAALALMAREGASGTSMRAVAAACGCNVATLYHYFPSKWDLLHAALAHRRGADLFAPPFPAAPDGPVAERLAALLEHLFAGMMADESFWRALLAEAIHGDEDVLQPLLHTSEAFEVALGAWLHDLLPDAPGILDPAVLRALRHALYGVLLEFLPQPEDRATVLAARARDLGLVFARLAAAVPEPLLAEST